jgi:hypothetical protein
MVQWINLLTIYAPTVQRLLADLYLYIYRHHHAPRRYLMITIQEVPCCVRETHMPKSNQALWSFMYATVTPTITWEFINYFHVKSYLRFKFIHGMCDTNTLIGTMWFTKLAATAPLSVIIIIISRSNLLSSKGYHEESITTHGFQEYSFLLLQYMQCTVRPYATTFAIIT